MALTGISLNSVDRSFLHKWHPCTHEERRASKKETEQLEQQSRHTLHAPLNTCIAGSGILIGALGQLSAKASSQTELERRLRQATDQVEREQQGYNMLLQDVDRLKTDLACTKTVAAAQVRRQQHR